MPPYKKLYPFKLTDSITLKPLRSGDSANYLNLIHANRKDFTTFDPFTNQFNTIDQVRNLLTKIEKSQDAGTSLTCGIWKNDELIGICEAGITPTNKSLRLAYALTKAHQGQGIITKTARNILGFAFANLSITHARLDTWIQNTPSIAVAERLGFQRQPELLPPEPETGNISERYLYVLTRDRAKEVGLID